MNKGGRQGKKSRGRIEKRTDIRNKKKERKEGEGKWERKNKERKEERKERKEGGITSGVKFKGSKNIS